MERSITVRTPEAIAFSYELAGLGSRFLALLIDLMIQGVTFFVFVFAVSLATPKATVLAREAHLNQHWLLSTLIAVGVLIVFSIFFGYFIVFEAVWNGQTPGKRLVGIRVVRDGGYPIELLDSSLRNLVRVLEATIGFYAMSVVSMLLSSENKRLGDYAAGTIVVRDRALEVTTPGSWLRSTTKDSSAIGSDALAGLSTDELLLVDRYVARKATLEPAAAQTTAAKIAAVVRPKLHGELATLSDDELLMKIATRDRS